MFFTDFTEELLNLSSLQYFFICISYEPQIQAFCNQVACPINNYAVNSSIFGKIQMESCRCVLIYPYMHMHNTNAPQKKPRAKKKNKSHTGIFKKFTFLKSHTNRFPKGGRQENK